MPAGSIVHVVKNVKANAAKAIVDELVADLNAYFRQAVRRCAAGEEQKRENVLSFHGQAGMVKKITRADVLFTEGGP